MSQIAILVIRSVLLFCGLSSFIFLIQTFYNLKDSSRLQLRFWYLKTFGLLMAYTSVLVITLQAINFTPTISFDLLVASDALWFLAAGSNLPVLIRQFHMIRFHEKLLTFVNKSRVSISNEVAPYKQYSSAMYRWFYILWVFIPILLNSSYRTWTSDASLSKYTRFTSSILFVQTAISCTFLSSSYSRNKHLDNFGMIVQSSMSCIIYNVHSFVSLISAIFKTPLITSYSQLVALFLLILVDWIYPAFVLREIESKENRNRINLPVADSDSVEKTGFGSLKITHKVSLETVKKANQKPPSILSIDSKIQNESTIVRTKGLFKQTSILTSLKEDGPDDIDKILNSYYMIVSLGEFLSKEYAVHYLLFLEDAKRYRETLQGNNDPNKLSTSIIDDYITIGAVNDINVPKKIRDLASVNPTMCIDSADRFVRKRLKEHCLNRVFNSL